MKYFLVIILFFSTALMAKPSTEKLAKIFVNNPKLANLLNLNNLDQLRVIKIKETSPGKNTISMVFGRSCHCEPMLADVVVKEDLTPTYSDGSPKYSTQVKLTSGFAGELTQSFFF